MPRLTSIPFLILMLALAACSPGKGPDVNPPPPGEEDPHPAKPLNVSLELDPARKVSGTFTPAGGRLELTAADGTRFTLTAPEGAVMSPLSVSMTPIRQIAGSPLKGDLLGAVHLEPEGALFYEPLTLTIQPTQPFDAAKLKAFNSHEMGKEFYFQPLTASGQTLTLHLSHFSNPGAAQATDLDEDLIPMPSDFADRFENDLGLDLSQESQIVGRFYGRVAKRLGAARGEISELKGALREFLTWRKEVARLGLDEIFKKQIFEGWTLVSQAIEAAVDQAVTACVVNNDPRFVQEILEWTAWIKRNPRLKPYFEGKLEAFETKTKKCLRFESTIIETGAAYTETSSVRAVVPMFLNATEGGFGAEYTGTGTLQSAAYTVQYPVCQVSGATQTGGTFEVRKLTLGWNDGKVGEVELEYFPGRTANSYSLVCPPAPPVVHTGRFFWTAVYSTILHLGEMNTTNATLTAKDWEMPGGEVIARKVYVQTKPLGPVTFSETTTISLVYAPQN